DLARRLADAYADVADYQMGTGVVRTNMAALLDHVGQTAAACPLQEEALAYYHAGVRTDLSPLHRQALRDGYERLAGLLLKTQRYAEAAQWTEQLLKVSSRQ